MDYSRVDVLPGNLVETPFTQIKKGDNFIMEGDNNTVYRAKDDVQLTDAGDGYFVIGENVDFEEKPFAVAKNSLAYAPKFYVVLRPADDTSD